MTCRLTSIATGFAGLVLLSVPAAAATIANCDSGFTICFIPENILLQFPGTVIAGDVILNEPGSSLVSDIFRISNNVVNTGAGTGLGNMVFLYSADETTLPIPSTYSANAVFITEAASGVTSYLGNGTTFLLGVPEPRTFGLLSSIIGAMVAMAHRSRIFRGDSVCHRSE